MKTIMMGLIFLVLAGLSTPAHAIDPPLTPLMQAAKKGNVLEINSLLSQGVDVNAVNRKQLAALYYAVRSGHVEAAKTLLAAGAGIAASSPGTLLAMPARKGNVEMVDVLLANGADINYLGTSNAPALYASVYDGDAINIDLIKKLIALGADVNAGNRHYNDTPLMQAINNGRLDVAQLLIDAGADIAVVNKIGRTALFYAAGTTHGDRIKSLNFLLENGADPSVQNKKGQNIAAFIEDLSLSYKLDKAKAGDGFEQYKLAQEYQKYPRAIFSQEKIRKTYAWALNTLEPLAKGGDAKAAYLIGYAEFFNRTGNKNTDSGLSWMIKAGQAGYRNAQWKLGDIYANGKGGLAVNKQKAIYWYELAAAQGSGSSKKALEKLKAE